MTTPINLYYDISMDDGDSRSIMGVLAVNGFSSEPPAKCKTPKEIMSWRKTPRGNNWQKNDTTNAARLYYRSQAMSHIKNGGWLGWAVGINGLMAVDIDCGAEGQLGNTFQRDMLTYYAVQSGSSIQKTANGYHAVFADMQDITGGSQTMTMCGCVVTYRKNSQIVIAPSPDKEWLRFYHPGKKSEMANYTAPHPALYPISNTKSVYTYATMLAYVFGFLYGYQPIDIIGDMKNYKQSYPELSLGYDIQMWLSHYYRIYCKLSLEQTRELFKIVYKEKYNEADTDKAYESADRDNVQTIATPVKTITDKYPELQWVINNILSPISNIVEHRNSPTAAARPPMSDVAESLIEYMVVRQTRGGAIIENCQANYIAYLNNHPDFKGKFKYNEASKTKIYNGAPLTDAISLSIFTRCEGDIIQLNSKQRCLDAIDHLCYLNRYNPVVEFLKAQTWDGISRIENALIKYMGCEDNEYSRGVSRLLFMGATHRAMRHGCKFDYVVVFEGEQGVGKSTMINMLTMPNHIQGSYYTNLVPSRLRENSIHKAVEDIQGKWIVELEEFSSMTRGAAAEDVKAFISTQSHRGRKAYGREVEDNPVSCVYIATTNDTEYLDDCTGNRRFYPVTVRPTSTRGKWSTALDDQKEFYDYMLQVWAEAYHLYNAGEGCVPSVTMMQLAAERAAAAQKTDSEADRIMSYAIKHPSVTTRDVFEYLHSGDKNIPALVPREIGHRICGVLRQNGWHVNRVTKAYGRCVKVHLNPNYEHNDDTASATIINLEAEAKRIHEEAEALKSKHPVAAKKVEDTQRVANSIAFFQQSSDATFESCFGSDIQPPVLL